MAKYRITYHNSRTSDGPEDVEATTVEHAGDWIIFKSGGGQPTLSLRATAVKRYERIGEEDVSIPTIV